MKKSSTPDKALSPPDSIKPSGTAGHLWSELITHLQATYPPVTLETKRAPKDGGWYLRVARRDRTILYLLPRADHFLTAFVFGAKATEVVRASTVPDHVIDALNAARPYVEGRGLRLVTRTRDDLAIMERLAAIKMTA